MKGRSQTRRAGWLRVVLVVSMAFAVHALGGSAQAAPAPSAAEVHLSVDAVKAHMHDLFERFGLGELPQNEKRTQLAAAVRGSGLIAPHDF